MDFAVQRLDLSLSHIHELTAEDVVGQSLEEVETVSPVNKERQPGERNTVDQASKALNANACDLRQEEQVMPLRPQNEEPGGMQFQLSSDCFYEDAILNAISDEALLRGEVIQQNSLLTSLAPISSAFDEIETTPRTLEYDYQQSD
jgi:hypothetical protein